MIKAPLTHKVCVRCGEDKSINEFPRVGGKSKTTRSECKTCYNAAKKTIYGGGEWKPTPKMPPAPASSAKSQGIVIMNHDTGEVFLAEVVAAHKLNFTPRQPARVLDFYKKQGYAVFEAGQRKNIRADEIKASEGAAD